MKEKTGYTFYSVFVFMGKECQKPQEKQIDVTLIIYMKQGEQWLNKYVQVSK